MNFKRVHFDVSSQSSKLGRGSYRFLLTREIINKQDSSGARKMTWSLETLESKHFCTRVADKVESIRLRTVLLVGTPGYIMQTLHEYVSHAYKESIT